MNQTQQIEDYKKRIYRKIPASANTRSRCIEVLNISLEDYLAEYPEAGFDDIIRTFGMPKEVAKQYTEEIDSEEIQRHKRKRLLYWTIPLALFLIATCVFLIVGYFHIISQAPVYIVEAPIENIASEYGAVEYFEN